MNATSGTASLRGTTCGAIQIGNDLAIIGSSGNLEVELVFANWGGTTGQSALGDPASNVFAEYDPSDTTTLNSQSGTVTLTSVTATYISGTFSFTCYDGTVVSGGSFTAQR